METTSQIPRKLTAGDTVTWSEVLPDYPAVTSALSIVLISAGAESKQTFDAIGSETTHTFTISALESATLTAGRYDYQLIATGDGYRSTLDRGSIEVLADLSTLTSHDGRDWLDTAIDALEASLAGRASNKQLVREFDGVRIQDMTLAEQIEALQEFKRMRVVKKGRWKKTITSRFVN